MSNVTDNYTRGEALLSPFQYHFTAEVLGKTINKLTLWQAIRQHDIDSISNEVQCLKTHKKHQKKP